MMKRLVWFLGGAAAGITGAGLAKRKVKSVAVELAPVNVAKKAGTRVRDAVQEGRRAMKAKEAELRARVNGDVRTLADELCEGDAVALAGIAGLLSNGAAVLAPLIPNRVPIAMLALPESVTFTRAFVDEPPTVQYHSSVE